MKRIYKNERLVRYALRFIISLSLIIAVTFGGMVSPAMALDISDWKYPSEYHDTINEAATDLLAGLKQHLVQIPVGYLTEDISEDVPFLWDIYHTATKHTGDPKEGDYLRWQLGVCQGGYLYYPGPGVKEVSLLYTPTYYTTLEQEEQLDVAIQALLDELNLYDATDYGKIVGVYDWICENVTYDNEHVSDPDYKLMRTAYGAMFNKTAVCQGYAVLLYRLLLELGVDNRVITGYGNGGYHAWNIVKLDGFYYNVDVTWDATWHQAGLEYNFLLCSDEEFGDHVRDEEYLTASFCRTYPMVGTEQTILFGDADGNGEVSVLDAMVVAQYIVGDLTEEQINMAAADVDHNGQVSVLDAMMIAQFIVGDIDSF